MHLWPVGWKRGKGNGKNSGIRMGGGFMQVWLTGLQKDYTKYETPRCRPWKYQVPYVSTIVFTEEARPPRFRLSLLLLKEEFNQKQTVNEYYCKIKTNFGLQNFPTLKLFNRTHRVSQGSGFQIWIQYLTEHENLYKINIGPGTRVSLVSTVISKLIWNRFIKNWRSKISRSYLFILTQLQGQILNVRCKMTKTKANLAIYR